MVERGRSNAERIRVSSGVKAAAANFNKAAPGPARVGPGLRCVSRGLYGPMYASRSPRRRPVADASFDTLPHTGPTTGRSEAAVTNRARPHHRDAPVGLRGGGARVPSAQGASYGDRGAAPTSPGPRVLRVSTPLGLPSRRCSARAGVAPWTASGGSRPGTGTITGISLATSRADEGFTGPPLIPPPLPPHPPGAPPTPPFRHAACPATTGHRTADQSTASDAEARVTAERQTSGSAYAAALAVCGATGPAAAVWRDLGLDEAAYP